MSMLSPETRAASPPAAQLAAMCTSGRPFSLMDVKVVDADGKPVPTWKPPSYDTAQKVKFDGAATEAAEADTEVADVDDAAPPEHEAVVGEVWVKGPTLCAGYWNRPEARTSTQTKVIMHPSLVRLFSSSRTTDN